MPRKLVLFLTLVLLAAGTVFAQETTPETTPDSTPEAATTDIPPETTPERTPEAPPPVPEFPGAGEYNVRTRFAGIQRVYYIYIPASYEERDEPAPLLLVFHGAGGTGQGIASFSQFNRLADENGFVVVYPDGVNNGWNDDRQTEAAGQSVDDLTYVAYIIASLSDSLDIDEARVYATGYSMGGMFAYRLACELADQIAAIATVATTFPAYLSDNCVVSDPMPVLMIQGTDDPVVPWSGVPGYYLSAAGSLRWWGQHNDCESASRMLVQDDVDPEDGTLVIVERRGDCADDADVLLYGIYQGGHTWPGRAIVAPFDLGPTSKDIDASEVIWTFFEGHSKE